MEEIWKDIVDYPNYMVSNLGNVKNKTTGKLLKGQNNGRGYLHVCLYNENHIGSCIMIHRLVAKAFIPTDNELFQINHIDECKWNNRVDNLEWVTSEQNINHGTHNERVGKNNPKRRPICSVNQNNEIMYFDSARHASRYYKEKGIKITPAGICKALKNQIYTYKNLAWFYQTDHIDRQKIKECFNVKKNGKKSVYCIDEYGNHNYFESLSEALRHYDLPLSQRYLIRQSINNGTLFNKCKWFYE